MPLHGALPLQVGVEGGVVGLRADCRRIKEDFGTLQNHSAGAFRIPLIPADADADAAVLRRPGFEACVAGAEVILLLIAGAVGDMALAIDAEDFTVSIGNRDTVEIARAVLLEKRDRD